MKTSTPFTIYNAAAGSGKTFTLVKEYLKLLLIAQNSGSYKNLLAITFTNKAVAEMKDRIIKALRLFSEEDSLSKPVPMLLQISEEIDLPVTELHTRSRKILKHLLHHYAGFSVETIDRFNHQLIRTFARDLKLASNFEVSLDTAQLLQEAVDKLISKAGIDKHITKVLIDFALEKTDDDRSWDISKDIVNASQILINENDITQVAALKQRSLEEFLQFSKWLRKEIHSAENIITHSANEVLERIASEELAFDDFMRSTLPKHFQSLKNGNYNVYANKLQENLESGGNSLYKKSTTEAIASTIDSITSYLLQKYLEIKTLVHEQKLYVSALKNLTPLSVINLVSKEMDIIKEEKNIVPISEFNSLINNEIKDQPVPFIYERMGEKYRHFFIDEFQDTSLLQWLNLLPLIDNSLSQQDLDENFGSLLLVGDAKQSIYRWRGGLPEQFMGLYGDVNPFSVQKDVKNLETNYRSTTEIIEFNNDFFSFVANHFGNPVHSNLYTIGNRQKSNHKKGGYVNFQFIEKQSKAEKNQSYPEMVYNTIMELKSQNFELSEICILTRKKKDGIALSTYLLERNIAVISQETLLLQYSSTVNCLVSALTVSLFPENGPARIQLLDFLHEHLNISEEKHTFFSRFLNLSLEDLSEKLKEYDLQLDFSFFSSVNLYECFEYLIRRLKLQEKADAYLFSFMDFVFDFEQQPQADKIAFLEYWEQKKDSASIPSVEGTNAVRVMTIHKAKGLEFPVVLFPYADLNLHYEMDAKIWFPLDHKDLPFQEVLLNFNKDVEFYGETGEAMYHEHRNTLELDAINLLYVTLTRAVEHLYIFSEMPSEIKNDKITTYNQFFSEFLKQRGLWKEGQLFYELGSKERSYLTEAAEIVSQTTPIYIATSPKEHDLNIVTTEALLWDTEVAAAISVGNLLHDTMSQINYSSDKDHVLENLKARGIIASDEFEQLKNKVSAIITHPELIYLFDSSEEVLNERDIITEAGFILRPDRLNFHNTKSVRIIDYKTGAPNYHHEEQIDGYASALMEMGYSISEKILIYTGEDEIIVNKF